MEHCWEDESVVRTVYFRMFEFKIKRCPRDKPHDWTQCPFAHPTEKARRRSPTRYKYNGTACADFRKNGVCRRGDACPFAHGVFEAWLHPARYRTKICTEAESCSRHVCFFAHSIDEVRESTSENLEIVNALKKELLVDLQSNKEHAEQLNRLYTTLAAAAVAQKIKAQHQRQQSATIQALQDLQEASSLGFLDASPTFSPTNAANNLARFLSHHLQQDSPVTQGLSPNFTASYPAVNGAGPFATQACQQMVPSDSASSMNTETGPSCATNVKVGDSIGVSPTPSAQREYWAGFNAGQEQAGAESMKWAVENSLPSALSHSSAQSVHDYIQWAQITLTGGPQQATSDTPMIFDYIDDQVQQKYLPERQSMSSETSNATIQQLSDIDMLGPSQYQLGSAKTDCGAYMPYIPSEYYDMAQAGTFAQPLAVIQEKAGSLQATNSVASDMLNDDSAQMPDGRHDVAPQFGSARADWKCLDDMREICQDTGLAEAFGKQMPKGDFYVDGMGFTKQVDNNSARNNAIAFDLRKVPARTKGGGHKPYWPFNISLEGEMAPPQKHLNRVRSVDKLFLELPRDVSELQQCEGLT